MKKVGTKDGKSSGKKSSDAIGPGDEHEIEPFPDLLSLVPRKPPNGATCLTDAETLILARINSIIGRNDSSEFQFPWLALSALTHPSFAVSAQASAYASYTAALAAPMFADNTTLFTSDSGDVVDMVMADVESQKQQPQLEQQQLEQQQQGQAEEQREQQEQSVGLKDGHNIKSTLPREGDASEVESV